MENSGGEGDVEEITED